MTNRDKIVIALSFVVGCMAAWVMNNTIVPPNPSDWL